MISLQASLAPKLPVTVFPFCSQSLTRLQGSLPLCSNLDDRPVAIYRKDSVYWERGIPKRYSTSLYYEIT